MPKKQVATSVDKKKFEQYPVLAISYRYLRKSRQLRVKTIEDKLYLYVAIDLNSKFTYAKLYKIQTRMADFFVQPYSSSAL